MPCRSSGLEPSSEGGFLVWRDDALAWRPWREKIGLHVRVVVPGDGGYHRSVDAGFSPGGGGSFSFADAGSNSREDEVIYAPSSSVLAPKGRGSHSSTLSVLVPEGRGSRLLYAVGLGPVVCWVWVLVGFWWKRCYGSCRQGVCSEKG